MSRIEEALEKAKRLRDGGGREEKREETVPPRMTTPSPAEGVSATNPLLVTLAEPDSPVAEEYRKLKSFVVNSTKKGGFQNVLMVTSTVGNEGKSLTALNLAITLAQEYDHTVLLIDADLRQPSLHRYLGIEPVVGLSECLSNGRDVSSAFIKTGIGKLVVLPAGGRSSNPVELLASNKMREIIREMKSRYADRYIIIDTPPVLPFAEAHAIGTMVDGVIFVVKERHAPLGNIKDALNILKDANVLGIVYNDVEIEPFDSYYHYYYHRYNYRNKKGNGNEKV